MESSRFLSACTDISRALFDNTSASELQANRLFCLQAGEALRLKPQQEETFLYLLKGSVEVQQHDTTRCLQEAEDSALRTLNIPQGDETVVVTALEDSVFNHVDARRLDDLITWVNIAAMLAAEPEKLSVLAQVMRTRSLTNLPVESVYELISRMRLRAVKQGEVIVEQGAQAEHFYILHRGEAEVWSLGLYDDEQQHVCTLHEGDCFGEDALVTGGTRSATVKMATDGVVLEGDKQDFLRLIAEPVIEEVEPDLVEVLRQRKEYQLLDVRYEEEHEDHHIEGSRLMPLHELRARVDELDPDTRYITYCRSGKRSAVAALVLKRQKIHAVSMKGGMNCWAD